MYNFDDLLKIVEKLRGEGGCPWDREQTYDSMKRYAIEEAYEVAEAAGGADKHALADELGDLLLQVVMYAQIGRELGDFSIDTVLDCVCSKMISRHPHVFGEAKAENSEEVLKIWGEIKKKEKGQKTRAEAMKGISKSLPSLLRACKVQESAAKAGFDWPDMSGAFSKLKEEVCELEAEIGNKERFSEEFGDLMFAAVNVARFGGIQPETAADAATEKFIRRFSGVEKLAEQSGRKMEDMTLSELDGLWDEVKKNEIG